MQVHTDYQESANLASYTTFAWLEQPDQVRDHLTTLGQINQHIEGVIEQELQADGFQKVATDPDFYVVYHTSVERVITGATLDTWGYGYRRGRLRYGSVAVTDVDVESYQQGTLIIDIVDAKANELVWRGTATDAIYGPRQATDKIDEAVHKMLAAFPPVS